MKILFLRGVFLLTILLSLQFQLIGQISTFELKAYKLTDVRLRSFTNQLYFDQNGYENKNMFNGTKLSSNNQLSVDYSGTYSLYKNTRPFQRITRVILDFDGYRSMNKVENQNVGPNIWRSYRWNTGAEYNDVFRKYINPKLFIETQFLAKYNFDQYHSYTRQFNVQVLESVVGEDNHLVSVGVPIKVGMGRLERVEDARQALFLLRELQEVNRLKESISSEEILHLSAFVSKLRNTRFFDTRLQRIYQLNKLDSFLQESGLTNAPDAAYFTTSMDYWMFGGGPIRESGNRLSLAFYPMIAWQNNRRSENGTLTSLMTRYKNEIKQGFVALEFNSEKPMKQKWQSSLNTSISFGNRIKNLNIEYIWADIDEKVKLPGVQFKFDYGIGFYPSTRTSVTWNVGVHLARINSKMGVNNQVFGHEIDRNVFGSNLNINYYVSPRFRIAANLNVRLLTVPSFTFYGFRNGWEFIQMSSIDIADSYFAHDQLIDIRGQTYNFEQSFLNTGINFRVLYSLF